MLLHESTVMPRDTVIEVDFFQFLQTVIPYKIPEGLRWRTDTLTQLTKGMKQSNAFRYLFFRTSKFTVRLFDTVLKAIAEGSNTVPKLMSEYLQSECKLILVCL